MALQEYYWGELDLLQGSEVASCVGFALVLVEQIVAARPLGPQATASGPAQAVVPGQEAEQGLAEERQIVRLAEHLQNYLKRHPQRTAVVVVG